MGDQEKKATPKRLGGLNSGLGRPDGRLGELGWLDGPCESVMSALLAVCSRRRAPGPAHDLLSAAPGVPCRCPARRRRRRALQPACCSTGRQRGRSQGACLQWLRRGTQLGPASKSPQPCRPGAAALVARTRLLCLHSALHRAVLTRTYPPPAVPAHFLCAKKSWMVPVPTCSRPPAGCPPACAHLPTARPGCRCGSCPPTSSAPRRRRTRRPPTSPASA